MTILIDADGCPVVDLTLQIAKRFGRLAVFSRFNRNSLRRTQSGHFAGLRQSGVRNIVYVPIPGVVARYSHVTVSFARNFPFANRAFRAVSSVGVLFGDIKDNLAVVDYNGNSVRRRFAPVRIKVLHRFVLFVAARHRYLIILN